MATKTKTQKSTIEVRYVDPFEVGGSVEKVWRENIVGNDPRIALSKILDTLKRNGCKKLSVSLKKGGK